VNWQPVFLDRDQVRPLWRFFLSLAMIGLAYVGVGVAAGSLEELLEHFGKRPGYFGEILLVNSLMFAALLIVFKVLTSAFERRAFGSFGLALGGRWHRELGRGVVVGTVMVLAVGGLERALRLATFTSGSYRAGVLAESGLVACAFLLLAAFNEEMVFRGYPFQRLVDAAGPLGAVVITSMLFGAVHLGNPHHTLASTLNTMLVGVPLSVAYLRTRALWLPVGIHFSWNLVLGAGLGLPVSGLNIPHSLLVSHVQGSALLTGSEYGPEGGLLATGVIVAATLYLAFSRSIYISEEMKKLVFAPPAPIGGSEQPEQLSIISSASEDVDPRELN